MMYTVHMKLTATEFRKHLFRLLDRVLAGQVLEVSYKSSMVRVTPVHSSSKLARARPQKTLACDPEEIVHSDPKLMEKMESEWRKDWMKL
jgi:antitoxin (DNA-binding transcriptional repressor) of toxin-antitoxin stability system